MKIGKQYAELFKHEHKNFFGDQLLVVLVGFPAPRTLHVHDLDDVRRHAIGIGAMATGFEQAPFVPNLRGEPVHQSGHALLEERFAARDLHERDNRKASTADTTSSTDIFRLLRQTWYGVSHQEHRRSQAVKPDKHTAVASVRGFAGI